MNVVSLTLWYYSALFKVGSQNQTSTLLTGCCEF